MEHARYNYRTTTEQVRLYRATQLICPLYAHPLQAQHSQYYLSGELPDDYDLRRIWEDPIWNVTIVREIPFNESIDFSHYITYSYAGMNLWDLGTQMQVSAEQILRNGLTHNLTVGPLNEWKYFQFIMVRA